jgi:RNA polymerase sigma-70 factor (ECF subfamily)
MGQEKQFLEAFDAYADVLYRHVFFRVSNKDLAHDLVQDTFMKTWDYLVKGNEVKEFKPFLFRTLNNLIIDEYRRKTTESLDALLDENEVPEGAFEELREGGLEALEIKLDAARLESYLQRMPEQYRQVVVMRYIDSLQPQEIADILGESVNVISVRIHRGIAWLRKEFSKT